ncbi:MAG: hypothetical protein WBD07_07125 [Vicinamibacterales bacterium]
MKPAAHLHKLIVCLIVASAAVAHAALQVSTCSDCLRARYWNVPPDGWATGTLTEFPETARLRERRPVDLGIAFSGGGTRSATATLGELRGLAQNGWLDRVRYITAVSGGAWAAVPFTFSKQERQVLLGRFDPPGRLVYKQVTDEPSGSLAAAVVNSSFAGPGFREAVGQIGQSLVSSAFAEYQDDLKGLLGKLGGGARSRTYARLLDTTFIEPLVPGGSGRFFAWDTETIGEALALNPTLSYADFLAAGSDDRPFLIVGASMVATHPNYDYPRLIPVEYTPLYAGVRQRFGRFGGTYIWSWAYGSSSLETPANGIVDVRRPASEPPFSLADVVASTGAAPQLFLLLGGPAPRAAAALQAAAGVFPSFRHAVVREGRASVATETLPHGDGGFTDNLGLMPLLARHVGNIIVFVNTKSEFDENKDIEEFFRPVRDQTPEGDRSMNHVFDESRYHELVAGFRDRLSRGQALVYCGRNWHVGSNEFYNISSYDGLNICWVYNHAATRWEDELPPDVRALLGETGENDTLGSFKNFPWYETFGQNKPSAIKLTTAQVNLLANLTSWSVTNEESIRVITEGLSVVSPPRP